MLSGPISKWIVGLVLAGLLGLSLGAAGVTVKIVADGVASHAVRAQLKIAHYRWRAGNLRGALQALRQAGVTVAPAGVRWQMAQLYFQLARHEYGRQPAQAQRLCQAALQALDFGRYDHTDSGTSTTAGQCAYLRPAD